MWTGKIPASTLFPVRTEILMFVSLLGKLKWIAKKDNVIKNSIKQEQNA
jgi:hypothetical protein